MRIAYGILALLWIGIFIAFTNGFEISRYGVGCLILIVIISAVKDMLADSESTTESYEISVYTAKVDGESVYVAEVKNSDGGTEVFGGETLEEARSNAMKYIEKESK